ncbi:MAG: hypothetical protein ACYDD1_11145 [Caulobacteraceae bacterium]
MVEFTNDNDTAGNKRPSQSPDAHGQAAMLLVESLLHGLVARSTLTVAEAVEIVDIAAEVQEAISNDLDDPPATMGQSLTILGVLRASLALDLTG